MADIIQIRRDDASVWTSVDPILAQGELGVELDTRKVKVGDGVNHWTDIDYLIDVGGYVTESQAVVNFVGEVNAQDFNASGEINAQDFNATSDISMKNSVSTIGNASEVIENLRGVSFKWNSTDKPAYGVVAQEVERVLPDLVSKNEDGVKSVKYLGLIGFLIESNKQLIQRMESLEQKLRDK